MGKAITSLSVSPDRKWLAYSEGDGQPGVDYAPDLEQLPPYWEGRSLVIVDGEAHEQQRIPFEQGWGLLSRWLTNETFLLRCARQNTSCPMYSARYVLYPFNKEVVELPEDPEDLSFFPNISDWHGQGLNSYDPTLSYRVYASDTGELILENIQSHKEVIRIITPLDIAPEWSPDGKQFVIALHPLSRPDSADLEFYGVKINGEMNQLTQLSALNIKLYPYNYSWAPDGKKVAFWISASIASDVNAVDFAVLDLSSNEVIVYSIRSTFKGPPMSVWSPMGDQVLIGTTNQMGESTFLLDFTENWFIQIAKDMVPVGWLVNDKK
jgi:WD40 repeat protein